MYVYIRTLIDAILSHMYIYVCMHPYVYVCMCTVYIYIYMYVYIHMSIDAILLNIFIVYPCIHCIQIHSSSIRISSFVYTSYIYTQQHTSIHNHRCDTFIHLHYLVIYLLCHHHECVDM